MELVVIRHGLPQTVILKNGAADPSLTDVGRAQAQRVGDWLTDERFDRIYSSPLARAQETAAPLAAGQDLPVALHEGIAEYDSESPVYVPMEDLKRDNYDEWRRIMDNNQFADDPDAFRGEVASAMEEIIAANRGKRVAVFCHGGVINAWASHVMETRQVFFFDPFYTSINRFMAASSGERTVITLNETTHLRGL